MYRLNWGSTSRCCSCGTVYGWDTSLCKGTYQLLTPGRCRTGIIKIAYLWSIYIIFFTIGFLATQWRDTDAGLVQAEEVQPRSEHAAPVQLLAPRPTGMKHTV